MYSESVNIYENFSASLQLVKRNRSLVPNSQMDAGWLLTIDQYLNLGVDWILTSVIQQMDEKPHYKYTHGDIYYFKRWYEIQNEDTKQRLKLYV